KSACLTRPGVGRTSGPGVPTNLRPRASPPRIRIAVQFLTWQSTRDSIATLAWLNARVTTENLLDYKDATLVWWPRNTGKSVGSRATLMRNGFGRFRGRWR